ncbi:MAG TPA: GTP-dependent dephospho-CoA kinase family protein [Methanoregulaceae archaeon]|nr:GTP-dependent dephospho-CoA kinase family protein [Methanoregulaceae archaeon]
MRRLPAEHRGAFRAPFGRLFPSIDEARACIRNGMILSVGDVVTHNLISGGLQPAVAVVDGYTERHVPIPLPRIPGSRTIRVRNPAGYLTDELIAAVRDALASPPTTIEVHGEEDLAVVPLALAAPDGAVLVYGQPGRGVVVTRIDPQQRRRAELLFALFEETEPGHIL